MNRVEGKEQAFQKFFDPYKNIRISIFVLGVLWGGWAYYNWSSLQGIISASVGGGFILVGLIWSVKKYLEKPLVLEQSSLHDAVFKPNMPEVLENLLRAGANPNILDTNFTSPLDRAYMQKNKPFVSLLLQHGANPDISEFGRKNKVDIVNFSKEVDSDILDQSPLHDAVFKRDEPEILENLLKAGANPNILDKNLISPLDWAYMQKNKPFVCMLLQYGANPDISEHGRQNKDKIINFANGMDLSQNKENDNRPEESNEDARGGHI